MRLRARLWQLIRRPLPLTLLVGGSLVGAALVVYAAGGTKTVWPHLFYLPVAVASLMWGTRIGVAAAVISGLLCGPLMPLDVAGGLPQTTVGWVARLGFFVAVASTVGVGRGRIVRLSRARQQLLSAVSHEVRTPLAAVLGFSEVVMDRFDNLTDQECREFSALIYQEATQLSDIIDHYVLEARVHPSMVVDAVDVHLDGIVEAVMATVPPALRSERISVATDSVIVRADPLRVRQLVRSLVNNAITYGGERLHVDVSAEGRYGVLTIRGVGKLSGPDRVGQRSASAALGAGLTVARELTWLMKGHLVIGTQDQRLFELKLPLARRTARNVDQRQPA